MFTFDEEKHEYKENGIILPSVTQVIEDNGLSDFSRIPYENLERARHKGEAYHLATEYWDKGILDEEKLSPILVPLLASWKLFRKEYEVRVIENEMCSYSKKHRFGFTLDRVIEVGGGPNKRWVGRKAVLEIKSGAIPKTVGLQTGAYKIGYNETHTPQVNLRLCFKPVDETKYIIKECDDPQDEVDFLHLLAATNIRKKLK